LWLPETPVDLVMDNFLVTWQRAPDSWNIAFDYEDASVTYQLSVKDPNSNVVLSVSDLSVTSY